MKKKKKGGTKGFLHKCAKALIILLIIEAVLTVLVIIGFSINHHLKLNNEKGYFADVPGQTVSVNGHDMNVITAGEGNSDFTLVFIHNTGVADTAVSLQPLFAKLDDKYSLAYVDRCGNGYSARNKSYDGEIDTQLTYVRDALKGAGVEAPYILVANGTGGLLETYWAKTYPEEVIGMIGIGAEYPEEYDGFTNPDDYCGFFKWVLLQFCKIGGQRVQKSVYPTNYGFVYTEKQMNIRKALISKGYYTQEMYNEDANMVENAHKVRDLGFPTDIPVLEILPNLIMEPYVNDDQYVKKELKSAQEQNPDFDYVSAYNEARIDYFKQFGNVTCVELAGPSEVYTYDPEGVSENIISFIEETVKK